MSRDWEVIEREYRAGQLSIRAIARQYEVTESAIRKRAGLEQWARDLTNQVHETVRSKLVRSEVRTPSRVSLRTEREVVATAAARGVDVILRHRRDCSRLAEVRDRLLLRLASLEADIIDLRTCTLFADILERITRTLERLHNAERQAFNLDAVIPQQDNDVARRDQQANSLLARLVHTGAANQALPMDTSESDSGQGVAK